MKLFRRLFAEKILRFHEGTNRVISALMKFPGIKNYINKDIFNQEQSRIRLLMGAVAQLVVVLFEFMRKFVYVLCFMYIPYRLIGNICPLVNTHQELTMIYMFIILSTICGSIANNTLMSMGDRDYLMIRIMQISPYMNFLGKLIYKIATDFIYFTVILCIYGVSLWNSIMLGLLTACARPIGEMFSIICFDHMRFLYDRRNTYNGIIMAIAVLLAYGMPILTGEIAPVWLTLIHPVFVLIMFLLGAGAMYYLWWYKYYRKIIREAMYIKREIE